MSVNDERPGKTFYKFVQDIEAEKQQEIMLKASTKIDDEAGLTSGELLLHRLRKILKKIEGVVK
jgi:hypothetical protein